MLSTVQLNNIMDLKQAKETKPEDEDMGCLIQAFHWLTRKLKLLEKGATPPNWKYILIIFTCWFASACSLTFVFPFLPEMILHLGYSEDEKGTYGGLIASSVFAGRIFSSMFWGWLADKRGRRIVLLCSVLLTGLSAGSFGFSINVPMAMCLRFLCGLSNGIVSTSKAALYDVSDNTNQAIGMTMLSLAWGSGTIVASMLSGLLSTPCSRWPEFCTEDSLLRQFPFLLPSLFPCVLCIVVSLLIFFKFGETLVASRRTQHIETTLQVAEGNQTHKTSQILSRSLISLNEEDISILLGMEVLQKAEKMHKHKLLHNKATSETDLVQKLNYKPFKFDLDHIELSKTTKSTSHIVRSSHSGFEPDISPRHESQSNRHAPSECKSNVINHECEHRMISPQTEDFLTVKDEVVDEDKLDSELSCLSTGSLVPKKKQEDNEDDDVCVCCDKCCELRCCSKLTNSSLHKLFRLSDIWSSIMLYSVLSFVTIAVNDIFPVFASTLKDYGGLGFTTQEIGLALGFYCLPLLVLQIKLYPFVVSKLGIRWSYMVMACVCFITCQCIPTLKALNNSPTWQWACLMLIMVPFKIAVNCCFASTSLLINNSAPQDLAGQANGLSMTTTAIGRSFAPQVSGLLYSWTVTYGQHIGAPFDTGFTFFVLGLLYAVSCAECLFISPRLNQQKK